MRVYVCVCGWGLGPTQPKAKQRKFYSKPSVLVGGSFESACLSLVVCVFFFLCERFALNPSLPRARCVHAFALLLLYLPVLRASCVVCCCHPLHEVLFCSNPRNPHNASFCFILFSHSHPLLSRADVAAAAAADDFVLRLGLDGDVPRGPRAAGQPNVVPFLAAQGLDLHGRLGV